MTVLIGYSSLSTAIDIIALSETVSTTTTIIIVIPTHSPVKRISSIAVTPISIFPSIIMALILLRRHPRAVVTILGVGAGIVIGVPPIAIAASTSATTTTTMTIIIMMVTVRMALA
jgi:hypothetical protein